MPRRKRASGEGGRKPKVCRVEDSEETLIISDSENEEEEDFEVSRSSRAARWRQRENKSKIQDMTEDEMLDLAMKLSAQEANTAAQRQQLEDHDMQKAIAESLNATDRDGSTEASGSHAHAQQSMSHVLSRLRRKLSYPSQNQTHGGSDVIVRDSTSPLPDMPDLSVTTASPCSLSTSVQFPKASQQIQESSQDKASDIQPNISDSEWDKLSRSVSLTQRSPVIPRQCGFIRQPLICVEKLSQDLISTSTDSRDHLHIQDSRVAPSQEESALSPRHIFTPNDLNKISDLDENDPCISQGSGSNTQIPDSSTYVDHKSLSPENTDPDECVSPTRSFQPSRSRCEPENAGVDVTLGGKTPEGSQKKDLISQPHSAKRCLNTQSLNEWTSHMVLHLPDDDGDDSSDEVLSPTPVVDNKTLDSVTENPQISQHSLRKDSGTSEGLKLESSDSTPLCTEMQKSERTVSYYWGVPFCPLGQNPDDYTRVIMCQLETYEKSLKEARRQLLRKVEWSQPVLPGSSERPFGQRRLKRHRAPRLSEDEEHEEDKDENERKEVLEEKDEVKSVVGSEDGTDERKSETYVVLSSPETKDDDVQKKPFHSQNEPTTANTQFRTDQWDASDNTQIEHADDEEQVQNHVHDDDEDIICPETQMSENNSPELMVTSPIQAESRANSEVMDVDADEGAPPEDEVVMEQESVSVDIAPPQNQRVECPMCSRLFPRSRIEMHAEFCDGEEDQDQQEEQSQVVRKTRTKRDPVEETQHTHEKSAQMEKCFLCQGLFPYQTYTAHVNLCFKLKDPNNQGNGLLLALQRTEQRRRTGSDEAGPSEVSPKISRGPTDSSGECLEVSAMTSSNICISVSDDTDLQQQESSKNLQRLTRKRKFKR